MGTKYVYSFGGGKAEGSARLRDLLGGKGAGLAEMTNAGLPVPPGFTITTEACKLYYRSAQVLPAEVESEIAHALAHLEEMRGERLGDAVKPLLVSVRSGAKFSMPGMMDTILNLGLNDTTVEALAKRTHDRRFAFDCYRRFIQMFGNVVLGIEKRKFETLIEEAKKASRITDDTHLSADDLQNIVNRYKELIVKETGEGFPGDPHDQLIQARDAVFRSWNNDRAITYRQIHNISQDLGTAVNIQAMVYGNLGETSGSGVGFTRNPATGEKALFGEFLPNAQGEDVVAGVRTPLPVSKLKEMLPDVYEQLATIATNLERHYGDVQDFEFTVQEGHLFMLQTRSGKRTGLAAVRIACEMVDEGLVTADQSLRLIEAPTLNQVLHPSFDTAKRREFRVIGRGLPSSPGAGAGRIAFTAKRAVAMRSKGDRVLLVRVETSPDDIAGMQASEGFLTARGGATSHAAVVGRQMGKPAVVGCAELTVDEETEVAHLRGVELHEGDYLSIDGTAGEVMQGDVPKKPSEVLQVVNGQMKPGESEVFTNFSRVLQTAQQAKRLVIRANADTPEDARLARAFGAEGIGLCRTEHMFFAPDRLPHMQAMILADDLDDRRAALDRLLPMQRNDFAEIFRVMDGFPVTIRLLDPPLHEFLPKIEQLMVDIAIMKAKGDIDGLDTKEKLLTRVQQLHEFNPMLGLRGCRLGILYPEVTEMQARAIFMAACVVAQEGVTVLPEIMVPLVGIPREFEMQRAIVDSAAREIAEQTGTTVNYLVGTMIELPRASLTAGEIAKIAEFFSFGTNDLTQTTFGFSRDDTTAVIEAYLKAGILDCDPFTVLDRTGVGELLRIGVERGRKERAGLKVGICGEHGGEPSSVEFCHQSGLDYVSCSPYRVPVATLAAAQAAVVDMATIVE
jgi:pyruvate,orthophosphate dikinase